MITQTLNRGWCIRPCTHGDWKIKANIPCSVLHAMLDAKLVCDPFYRKNEYEVRELFNQDFCYTLCFVPQKEILKQEYAELVFYGLDTLADIRLNGEFLASVDNMHRTWRLPVAGKLKKGENHLEIIFRSSLKFIREKGQDPSIHYVAKGCIRGNNYLRKAHCMFGWDWGPQLPDAGIWRPVELCAFSDARIADVRIKQEHCTGTVFLQTEVRLAQLADLESYTVCCTLTSPSGDALYAQSVSAEETAAVSFVLKSPQLWWPNTYGEQPLYTLNVELHDKDSQVLDDWHKQIGLRELTISRNQDEWGEEFCFRVNGVKIFAMGADYIPEDSVVTRVTPEQTLRLLKDCAAANFNTIRVWGGGYYPDDWFYDACDRLGLIVWQDAMFACNVYRMDAAFEENIRAELRDNLLRIRHHACLGLLCGNNEMELGWVGWEDVVTHHPALKADYIKMFEYVISQEAQINAPDVFYWPSSPSSGGSFDDPNAENRGDVHYWDVWHRMKPFTDYEKFYFRFCSEFGFESFPGRKTIETFTEPSDRNIFSPVMESHQKNGAANGLIMFYISSYYRYPKDFDSLLYISQLLQAEAMRHGVEHWRRNRGRCMGAIYWQLNDCWPVASWASIDYFGRWKALHYYARRFFSPRMVTAKAEDAKLRMWVHNDSRTALEGTVEVELRDTAYGLLAHMEVPVQVPPLSVTELDPIDFMQELAERGQDTVFVAYRLCEKNNTGAYASTLFCRPKQMELPRPNYTVHVLDCGNVFDIYVKSDCYAHQVEIETNLTDRPFSDNYFSLCTPQGVHVALEKDSVAPGVTAEQLRESLQVRSVADTF